MKKRWYLLFVLCAAFLLCVLLSGREAARRAPAVPGPEIQPRQANEEESYIKIGFYGSLTGDASVLGQMGQQGCRLAVDEINNEGGIRGKRIRLIEYDDQTDPDLAETVVRKMAGEDCVDAIIGSHTSGNIIGTAPLTEQAHVLQIGLGTSFIWTGIGCQYLFRSTGNSRNYDKAIFSAIKEAGHQKIGVYYCTTDYARAGAEELREFIQKDDSMRLVWFRSNDISQTDFVPDFLSLVASGAEALILYASSENAGTQLKQLREIAGYKGAVYAPEAFANTTSRQEAGNNLKGLVFACTNVIPESPQQARSEKERAFLESFIKMYGTMPVAETAYRGYDAMMILAEVFRNAESMDSGDLRQAMLELTDYEGVSGVYDFSDGSGDGLQGCLVVTMAETNQMNIKSYP